MPKHCDECWSTARLPAYLDRCAEVEKRPSTEFLLKHYNIYIHIYIYIHTYGKKDWDGIFLPFNGTCPFNGTRLKDLLLSSCRLPQARTRVNQTSSLKQALPGKTCVLWHLHLSHVVSTLAQAHHRTTTPASEVLHTEL